MSIWSYDHIDVAVELQTISSGHFHCRTLTCNLKIVFFNFTLDVYWALKEGCSHSFQNIVLSCSLRILFLISDCNGMCRNASLALLLTKLLWPLPVKLLHELKIFNPKSFRHYSFKYNLIVWFKTVYGFSDIALLEIFYSAHPWSRRRHQFLLVECCSAKLPILYVASMELTFCH